MKKSRLIRGSALISAVFLVAASSLLIGGAATLVMSHNTLAQRDADYAASMQLAEAGVNYELWYISQHVSDSGGMKVHQLASPYSGSITGVDGTYSVGVADSSGASWSSGEDMYVTSTGTVGGISRSVRVYATTSGGTGSSKSALTVFDTYALFATNSISISNDLIMTGSLGSNGSDTITSGSNFKVSGTIDKCGSGATLSWPSWYQWDTYLNDLFTNRVKTVATQNYQTVDDLVALAFPGQGWAWLKNSTTNRSNGKIKMYKATYTTMPTATPKAIWTASCIDMTDANIDSIANAQNGGISQGMGTDCTLVFSAGDYYFQSWNMSGNKRFIIDNASGPVRIWMDDANKSVATTDSMSGSGGNFYYTGPNPAQGFRFYYNKNGTMTLSGSTTCGGFYMVNAAGNAKIANNGSCAITGSVIANVVNFNAAMTLTSPSGGTSNPAADPGSVATPSGYYAFSGQWKEVPISGTTVFNDGSTY